VRETDEHNEASQSGPSEPPEPLTDKLVKLAPLAPFLLVAVVITLTLFTPASLCERVGNHRWRLEGARVLRGEGSSALLLHLYSLGRHRQRSYNKLVTLDLEGGRELGSYVTHDWVKPFGLTTQLLWLRQGGIKRKRWTAYALPSLAQKHELDELLRDHPRVAKGPRDVRFAPASARLGVQDKRGRWFSLDPASNAIEPIDQPRFDWQVGGALTVPVCDHPPRPPRMVGDELLLEGAFVCDNVTGELLELGGGDRLIAYQDLERETGKLIVGRLTTDSRWAWRFTEQERFGRRPRGENGYRVEFAFHTGAHIVLVLPLDEGAEDVRVVAIDPGDGAMVWQRRYE